MVHDGDTHMLMQTVRRVIRMILFGVVTLPGRGKIEKANRTAREEKKYKLDFIGNAFYNRFIRKFAAYLANFFVKQEEEKEWRKKQCM